MFVAIAHRIETKTSGKIIVQVRRNSQTTALQPAVIIGVIGICRTQYPQTSTKRSTAAYWWQEGWSLAGAESTKVNRVGLIKGIPCLYVLKMDVPSNSKVCSSYALLKKSQKYFKCMNYKIKTLRDGSAEAKNGEGIGKRNGIQASDSFDELPLTGIPREIH